MESRSVRSTSTARTTLSHRQYTKKNRHDERVLLDTLPLDVQEAIILEELLYVLMVCIRLSEDWMTCL